MSRFNQTNKINHPVRRNESEEDDDDDVTMVDAPPLHQQEPINEHEQKDAMADESSTEDTSSESELESTDSIYGDAPPIDSRQYSRWSQLVHMKHERDRTLPYPYAANDQECVANLCPVEDQADEIAYDSDEEEKTGVVDYKRREANQLMVATDTRVQSASIASLYPGAPPIKDTWKYEDEILDPDSRRRVYREAMDEMDHLRPQTRALLDELFEYQDEWSDHPFDGISLKQFHEMIDQHLELNHPVVGDKTVQILQELKEKLKQSEANTQAYLNTPHTAIGLDLMVISPHLWEQHQLKQEIDQQTKKLASLESPLWQQCVQYVEDKRKMDDVLDEDAELDELLDEAEADRSGRLEWMLEQLQLSFDALGGHLKWKDVMLFLKQDSFMGVSSNQCIQQLLNQPSFSIEPHALVKDWSGWTICRSNELDGTIAVDRQKLRALDLLIDLVTEISDDRLEMYEKLQDEYDLVCASFQHLAKSIEIIQERCEKSNDQTTAAAASSISLSQPTSLMLKKLIAELTNINSYINGTLVSFDQLMTPTTTPGSTRKSTVATELSDTTAAAAAHDVSTTKKRSRATGGDEDEGAAQKIKKSKSSSTTDTTIVTSSFSNSPYEQLTLHYAQHKYELKQAYERVNHLLKADEEKRQLWFELLANYSVLMEQLKCDTILPYPIIESLIDEIEDDLRDRHDWSPEAVSALHHAAESCLIEHLFDSAPRQLYFAQLTFRQFESPPPQQLLFTYHVGSRCNPQAEHHGEHNIMIPLDHESSITPLTSTAPLTYISPQIQPLLSQINSNRTNWTPVE